jgi:outer membrane protein
MKKKLLIASAILFGSFSYANDFKLGYVDVSKIFTTAKPAVALQNSLKAKFDPQQQELKKLDDNLVTEQTQIKELQTKSGGKDTVKLNKLIAQAEKDQMLFRQKYMMLQQSMQKTQDYASALLLTKVNTILKDISDSGGYDLVLTSTQMVYAKPKYDLTDQVIEQLKNVNADELVKKLNDAEKQQINSAQNFGQVK